MEFERKKTKNDKILKFFNNLKSLKKTWNFEGISTKIGQKLIKIEQEDVVSETVLFLGFKKFSKFFYSLFSVKKNYFFWKLLFVES